MMQALIDFLAASVPAALTEIRRIGRTSKQRAADVLALFGRPGTSNGPIETVNGRLQHLPGSALGFRNLTTSSRPPPLSSPSRKPITPPAKATKRPFPP